MKNYKYSFYQFSPTVPTDGDCVFKLPNVGGFIDMQFYADFQQSVSTVTIDVVVVGGATFANIPKTLTTYSTNVRHVRVFHALTLPEKKCFYLKLTYNGNVRYSNLFYQDSTATVLKAFYWCFEPQFEFPYDLTKAYFGQVVTLPMRLHAPQFPQDDNVYIDGNGVRHLLSSKIDKEFELETEYMPEDWHEKTVVMLAHDWVALNDTRLQKSAPYEIDYEEEDKLPCGITLNKASAKLTKNTTIRNSNC